MNVRRWDLLAALALVVLVCGVQYASGAYHCDFAADEDEPAHVVSSLMVHDYLVRDLPHNPLQFAKTYYLHYPKVAIGHWPPGFHISEALWMLIFGRSRAALVSLLAVVSAALTVSVFLWVRRDAGRLVAFLAAAVLATRPVVQIAAFSVQTDILLALFAFWAVAAYGVFLEQRRRRYLLTFLLFALCALAVHGRGAALAFVPAVAALLLGRSKYRTQWVLVIVALAAVALFVPRALGQAEPSTAATVFEHAWRTFYQVCSLAGWAVAAVALVGAVAVFRLRASSPAPLAMLALFLSNWLFASLVNVSLEERYLLVAMPVVAVLFGAAWRYLSNILLGRSIAAQVMTVVWTLIACVAIGRNLLAVQTKPDLLCHRLVREARFPGSTSDVYLVAGGAIPEGAFIAEMALRDPQLKCFVLRASKVLAVSSWSGSHYQTRFPNAAAVSAFLDRAHVGVVLMEPAKAPEHMQELALALESDPSVWQPVSGLATAATLRVFRRIGPMPEGAPDLRIDLNDKLGPYVQTGK